MMVHLRYHLRQGYGDQRKLWWMKNDGIVEYWNNGKKDVSS